MSDKQKKNRQVKRKAPKTAWKPGQSGNPGGRPKKINCIPDILNELGMKNHSKGKTKLRAVMEKVYELALAGTPWAVEYVSQRTEGKVTQKLDVKVEERERNKGEKPMDYLNDYINKISKRAEA